MISEYTKRRIFIELAKDDAIPLGEASEVMALLMGGTIQSDAPVVQVPKLLTTAEAAMFLGRSRVFLWNVIRKGLLKPVEKVKCHSSKPKFLWSMDELVRFKELYCTRRHYGQGRRQHQG